MLLRRRREGGALEIDSDPFRSQAPKMPSAMQRCAVSQSMGHHPGEAVCWLQDQAQVVAPILIHQGSRKVGGEGVKKGRSEVVRYGDGCACLSYLDRRNKH